MGKYILDENGEPQLETDLIKWATWYETSGHLRRVGKDKTSTGIEVSTVFLSLDYNFGPTGPPLLFETMIFPTGAESYLFRRYSTRQEAITGHGEALREVMRTVTN